MHADLVLNHMQGVSGFPSLLSEWEEQGHVRINHSKGFIEFNNGSKIHLCHVLYLKDIYKYQGSEMSVLLVDEGTHFEEKMYRYLRGRLRLGSLKIPDKYKGMFPRAIIGSNPGGIGHNWIKASFIDSAKPMEIIKQSKAEGGMLRQYIPAKLDDNPTLVENDPDYIEKLEGLGDAALVKAMRDGDWNIISGGAFDGDWDKATHEIEPFSVPSSWRIDRGFDWGSSKPFAVVYFAESDGTPATLADGIQRNFPRGSIFIISEWYGWNGKANEGCRMINTEIARGVRSRDLEFKRTVHPGPADNSISDVVNNTSIADDMARAPNYIRWTKSDKSPGSRRNGWEIMRKMLKNARGREFPGLFVFNTCLHTIRTVPVLPRDDNKDGDIDTDAEDHIADVIRYRVSAKRRTMSVGALNI